MANLNYSDVLEDLERRLGILINTLIVETKLDHRMNCRVIRWQIKSAQTDVKFYSEKKRSHRE